MCLRDKISSDIKSERNIYMRKKLLSLLMAATMASLTLAGCGETEKTSSPVIIEPEIIKPSEESVAPESSETQVESSVEIEVEENHDNEYRSELTNEWIDIDLEDQRPVAIIVDNELTALDHYGLTQADIVYEIMNSTANGEITRFMCLVKDWDSITRFGSIRSVRPTHLMLAPEYNAIVIHDGGPYYIDAYLANPWVDNLSGGFARIENGKPREFTEYVTTGEIADRIKTAKYDTEYNEYYRGAHFLFADEKEPMDLEDIYNSSDCTFIDLPFPHNKSELEYDEETNTYLYSEYDKAHIDLENDNKQLAFTNVIIQCAELKKLDDNGYMEFNIINQQGKAYYITGGKSIPVTWTKTHDTEPTRYYDSTGQEIILNTGKTYIGFVASTRWNELVIK